MKKWIITFIAVTIVGLIFWSCSSDENTTEPANKLPTCSILSPSVNTTLIEGDSIFISVEANDVDGTIGEIRFYIDDLGIGNDTTYPYSIVHTIPSFQPGQHLLRVIAKDNEGSEFSDSLYFGIAPKAPSELSVIQNNVSTFTLNWTDNSNGEDGFKVERKIDDGTFAVIATLTGTSYVDNTVAKGFGTVYYQVRAYKGTTYFSNYATISSAVTFPAPTNLIATQTSIMIANLSWTDNSLGEEKFVIERKLSTESTYVKIGEVTGSDTTSKSWEDTNLAQDMTYDYRVNAVKGLNSSKYITKTGYLNAFNAPTNFTSAQTNLTTAALSWTDSYTGEDKFEIERKLTSESTYTKIGEVIGSDTSVKIYTDASIEPNLTYNYRVRIVDGTAYSAYATATHANPFNAPTSLTVSVLSETSIGLGWTDNSSYEAGFKIDRKVSSTGTWATDFATVGANVKIWTDSGLTTGTTYYYKVRAYYSTYYSSYTSEVNATLQEIVPAGFISIPTGSFNMGSATAYFDEQPIHKVNISRAFYLGKYEITQMEWTNIMGSNPASGYGVGDNYPVYYVSWYSILVYCNKRSMNEGLAPCYTISGSTDPAVWGAVPTSSNPTWNAVTCNFNAKGYRLPTEAEWEYAARYNDGRTYPWGEIAPSSILCNYNNYIGATPVGSYPTGNSNLGLCDMAGNVWEFVWDWYGIYPNNEQTDPDGPDTVQSYRVLRGGPWHGYDDYMRCADRDYFFPYGDSGDFAIGFRLAKTR